MIWQDSSVLEVENDHLPSLSNQRTNSTILENNQKDFIQLQKYCDHDSKRHRKALLNVVERFENLFKQESLEEIDRLLVTEDCQLFIVDNLKLTKVKFSERLGDGFCQVFEGLKIYDREIIETSVDVQRNTVLQICKCQITKGSEDSELLIENRVNCVYTQIFTINNHKISKYMAIFAPILPVHGPKPLEKNIRERILARVKELNYALAGEPNFEKLSNMLDEQTEYKIWSWDDQKLFLFGKDELKKNFDKLQERMKITQIVPYDMLTHSDDCRKGLATYVYYLEELETQKKYVWISSVVYQFTYDLRIEKITQLGELYPEDEASIPFEAIDREELLNITKSWFAKIGPCREITYESRVDNDVCFVRFGPQNTNNLGTLKKASSIMLVENMCPLPLSAKCLGYAVADIFIDQQEPAYDVAFLLFSGEYEMKPGDETSRASPISLIKLSYANGKIVRMDHFFSLVNEKVPSPFDNSDYETSNIISRGKFYSQQE